MNFKKEALAIDFIRGLDNAKYGAFMMAMMSRWASKVTPPPMMSNEIYRLSGSWVKQPTHTKGGGYAVTNLTIEEEPR
jgi:hypothetical protein